jgi:hypothetical protein
MSHVIGNDELPNKGRPTDSVGVSKMATDASQHAHYVLREVLSELPPWFVESGKLSSHSVTNRSLSCMST